MISLRKILFAIFAPLYLFTTIAGFMLIGYAIIFYPFTKADDYWMQWVVLFAIFPFLMLWELTSLAVIQSVKKRLGLVRR